MLKTILTYFSTRRKVMAYFIYDDGEISSRLIDPETDMFDFGSGRYIVDSRKFFLTHLFIIGAIRCLMYDIRNPNPLCLPIGSSVCDNINENLNRVN